MRFKKISIWLSLLAAIYALTACDQVYDDLSRCVGNTIVFSYMADDDQEHLAEYVDGIEVFIFDSENQLVEKHHLDKQQVTGELDVKLPKGQYRVVAVGNVFQETVMRGEDVYANGVIARPELIDKDGKAAATYDRLYLGETMITSAIRGEKDVVRLYSQHVKIHAVVLSEEDSSAAQWFEANKSEGFHLTMSPLSARLSFSGSRSGQTSFDLPFMSKEKDFNFTLDFNTLRFKNDDPIEIRLMQGDEVLCTVDVAAYIALYSKYIEITGKQEALLPLYFRQNPTLLSVRVLPWEAVDVVPVI